MDDSQKKQATIVILRLLAASPKSRAEISKKLAQKGFDETVITQALDDFERQGILNDKVFAKDVVSKFVHAKPSGSRKIKFELQKHGLSPKTVSEMMESLDSSEETERARELARARWDRLGNIELEKRKKRVFDFLLRRGFDYQTVRDIMETIERDHD